MTAYATPPSHPLRVELNDEAHARPPEAMTPPMQISYLAMLSDPGERERERQLVGDLSESFGNAGPRQGANHFRADLGPFRLKWERHSEFTRYKFMVDGAGVDPFADPAIDAIPSAWLESIPGQVLVATHVALLPAVAEAPDHEAIARRLFAGNPLIGAKIAGGAAAAFTDFRIHSDGFSRLLVLDRGLRPRQAGRTVQRLLEIDTYRLMALLALPVAREMTPFLSRSERELAEITKVLAVATEQDEPLLLNRLTRLDAEIELRQADNHFRFAAAAAYYEQVLRRISELREERIEGLQIFREFTERRLAPAMNTCRAAASRQESLSQRVARTTQLLATRVDVTRELQNQAVLESMDRRAKAQLQLQETVEGLSVAAVTYYVVGLVGYLAKGLKAAGLHLDPELIMGVSIPIVAITVAMGVRKIRKVVTRKVVPRRVD